MVANSHNEYGSKCTGQSTLTSKHSKCHIVHKYNYAWQCEFHRTCKSAIVPEI